MVAMDANGLFSSCRMSRCSVMFVFHVQYLFVIIVMCCRLLKIRCDKTQFVSSSRTSKNIFQNVLKAMSKHAPENLGQYVQVKWYLDLLTSEAIPYVGVGWESLYYCTWGMYVSIYVFTVRSPVKYIYI